MQTYFEQELSLLKSSYLDKKLFNLPGQLERTYRKLDELEAAARLFGLEQHIRTPFNRPPSTLSDAELLERHIQSRRKFRTHPATKQTQETQTNAHSNT